MQETQFDRERMLLGDEAIDLLKECHVAVFGVGGVGSFAAEALARAGVGAITLVDHDTVSLTNLNRQLVALHSTIGKAKTDVMAERIRDIHPDCRVTVLPVFYEPETREDSFPAALATLPTASTPRAANWTSSRRPSRGAFRSSARWEPETGSTPRNSGLPT